MNEEELEDLIDIIIAEERKNDEKITIKELGKQLRQEGLLSNTDRNQEQFSESL